MRYGVSARFGRASSPHSVPTPPFTSPPRSTGLNACNSGAVVTVPDSQMSPAATSAAGTPSRAAASISVSASAAGQGGADLVTLCYTSADFREGLAELAEWVASQTAVDNVEKMRAELDKRGLVA